MVERRALTVVEKDLSRANSLEIYLAQVGSIPLLTHDQEISLAQQIEIGGWAKAKLQEEGLRDPFKKESLRNQAGVGEIAKTAFINANLRLVISIAKKNYGKLPLPDLIQEGNLGLIHAVEKYDWRRGYRFSTYASWWIRQSIQRGIYEQGKIIRLPVHMMERISVLRGTVVKLSSAAQKTPGISELAEDLGINQKEVLRLIQLDQEAVSLDAPVKNDDSGGTFADFLPDPLLVEDQVLQKVGSDEMLDRINRLTTDGVMTDREREVLLRRYYGPSKLTLEEIGKPIGITRERVRQIEELALKKLWEELTRSGEYKDKKFRARKVSLRPESNR